MSELYWISVLGTLNKVLGVVAIICMILIFAFVLCSPIISDMIVEYTESKEQEDKCKANISTALKFVFFLGVFSSLAYVFVPSKSDLYMIYGVGSVVDYVKENETAQGIPDKCVKALDKWAESLLDDEKETEKSE